jgi:leucyl/phenylalanyl-tRNA--protein transferase
MADANRSEPRIVIHWLRGPDDPLPATGLALPLGSDAPGLLAAGGHPTPQRLAEAYSRGIFPWYSEGQPVLRKTVRRFKDDTRCELRIDSAFRRVITACAQTPRDGQDGTWIVPEMIEAYCEWHALGHAHSFETWIDGELVGGLYGIGLGRMFFGESMFAHRTDASKIAFTALVCFCRESRVPMIDCQQHTSHLASMGARELRRAEFEARLALRLGEPPITDWTYDLAMWRHLSDGAAERP